MTKESVHVLIPHTTNSACGKPFYRNAAYRDMVTCHNMSPKHLHRYVNEFSFRHNTARAGTMNFIDMTVEKMANRRLTYKELINA